MKTNILPELTWRWLDVNAIDVDEAGEKIEYRQKLTQGGTVKLDPKMDAWLEEAPAIGAEVLRENREKLNYRQRVVLADGADEKWTFSLSAESPRLVDRQQLVVPPACHARVLLRLTSPDDLEGLRNGTLTVDVGEDGVLDLAILQEFGRQTESVLHIVGRVADGGQLNLTQLELGASNSAVHYSCDLLGFDAATDVSGIYFVDGDRKLDLFYNVRHIGEESKSDIVVNGALLDRARKSFRGTINFLEGSGGSVGDEQEYAVLLSEEVRAIAVPILLCHEDDVEGNHAASAGRIDEEQLFYLMSRGFDRKEAEGLLVEAKMTPTIDRLNDTALASELRTKLHERIVRR
uniref:SufB/SufD family protein n=1 Tax=Ndongobacter massiliensis TaxID=1871025 RepID=UPI000930B34D|nr:SufD family Fe-S cluster assembly protein [Ndongobacter massiliensis]